MNDLTKEQAQAYVELNIAIENCFRAHDFPGGFVLSDYIVLCSIQKLGDDNEVYTVYPVLLKDGDLPWHIIHGLLEKHRLEFNKASLEGDDNG